MDLPKFPSEVLENKKTRIIFFSSFIVVLIAFLVFFFVVRRPSLFGGEFAGWWKGGGNTETQDFEEQRQPSPPTYFRDVLEGSYAEDIEIKIDNQYPSLELDVHENRIERFLIGKDILPGRNCFFDGPNEGECFKNKDLRIKFSTQEIVASATEVGLGENKAIYYFLKEGGPEELVVVFRFDSVEDIDPSLLTLLVNQGLVESFIYSTYDKDKPGSFLKVRELAKEEWELISSSGNYFIELN